LVEASIKAAHGTQERFNRALQQRAPPRPRHGRRHSKDLP